MVDHVFSMDQMNIIVNVDPDIAALIAKLRNKFQLPHNHFFQRNNRLRVLSLASNATLVKIAEVKKTLLNVFNFERQMLNKNELYILQKVRSKQSQGKRRVMTDLKSLKKIQSVLEYKCPYQTFKSQLL